MHIFSFFVLFSCGCGVILLAVGFYEISWIRSQNEVTKSKEMDKKSVHARVYAVFGHDTEFHYLKHVFEIFESFGFVRKSSDFEWDVLWAHDYPFRKLSNRLKKLKPHQKVNHFPGTGFITNKLDLAKTNSKYIPKAFQMPEQKDILLKYVAKHHKKMFVQKSNDHRGIQIEKIENFDLSTEGTFIQEFVDNPLLIDEHKFDIGVYTIITSVEPLRVYIYNGDILFRFCPKKYEPFDPKDKDKYVIGDDYLPLWKIPSLSRYFNDGGYSMKDSFNAYMRSKGRNPEPIWSKVEDAIRSVVVSKEPSILNVVKNYPSKRNFFEMVRFDFVIDNDMNVFIMEANMSPNLSSAHFPSNRLIYHQVLFNLFSLIGMANYKRNMREDMEVSMKNLMVYPEQCSNDLCHSCFSSLCQLCLKCLSSESIEYLKATYIEYNNRQDCKRIFPPTFDEHSMEMNDTSNYSPDNLLLLNWFKGKCILDKKWC